MNTIDPVSNSYYTLHDNGGIKCIVGQGFLADCVKSAVGTAENVSFEHLQSQPPDWIKSRQFLVATSDVKFKQQVVQYLDQLNAHYFSLVGKNNLLGDQARIGKGTYINMYNDLLSAPSIGNHCVITTHCQLSHNVVVGDFSHVSSYCYLNNITLGRGNVVGLRATAVTKVHIHSADYCNFIINSVITNSVDQTGTYFGNRKLSALSSLENRIL